MEKLSPPHQTLFNLCDIFKINHDLDFTSNQTGLIFEKNVAELIGYSITLQIKKLISKSFQLVRQKNSQIFSNMSNEENSKMKIIPQFQKEGIINYLDNFSCISKNSNPFNYLQAHFLKGLQNDYLRMINTSSQNVTSRKGSFKYYITKNMNEKFQTDKCHNYLDMQEGIFNYFATGNTSILNTQFNSNCDLSSKISSMNPISTSNLLIYSSQNIEKTVDEKNSTLIVSKDHIYSILHEIDPKLSRLYCSWFDSQILNR